jgi:hypothetical protein
VPKPYYCTTSLDCTAPRNLCPQSAVQTELYCLFNSKKHSNQPRILCPQTASKTMPSSLLYRVYGSIQYGFQQQQITQQLHTKNHLGKSAQSPLGNVSSLLPFPLLLKALSKISQSLLLIVSCTLPNAFSYNSKVTFHLPSVFSPSPSLN